MAEQADSQQHLLLGGKTATSTCPWEESQPPAFALGREDGDQELFLGGKTQLSAQLGKDCASHRALPTEICTLLGCGGQHFGHLTAKGGLCSDAEARSHVTTVSCEHDLMGEQACLVEGRSSHTGKVAGGWCSRNEDHEGP